jgi:hypothetical protein
MENTQVSIEAISWLKQNLKPGERIVALSGLPIELALGWLPVLPLSQQGYQIYHNDTERIIRVLQMKKDIKIVLVRIFRGGYNFGIQDYRLAEYLDQNWEQVFRIGVPNSLTMLTLFSPERKKDADLKEGVIIFRRTN